MLQNLPPKCFCSGVEPDNFPIPIELEDWVSIYYFLKHPAEDTHVHWRDYLLSSLWARVAEEGWSKYRQLTLGWKQRRYWIYILVKNKLCLVSRKQQLSPKEENILCVSSKRTKVINRDPRQEQRTSFPPQSRQGHPFNLKSILLPELSLVSHFYPRINSNQGAK